MKPIEQVREGDRVLALDVRNGALVEGSVERTFVHPATTSLVRINRDLVTTPEHLFFANGTWIQADKLRLGDRLLQAVSLPGGGGVLTQALEVTRLVEFTGGVTTYNLDVAEWHVYFAGGVLVHNLKGTPGRGANHDYSFLACT